MFASIKQTLFLSKYIPQCHPVCIRYQVCSPGPSSAIIGPYVCLALLWVLRSVVDMASAGNSICVICLNRTAASLVLLELPPTMPHSILYSHAASHLIIHNTMFNLNFIIIIFFSKRLYGFINAIYSEIWAISRSMLRNVIFGFALEKNGFLKRFIGRDGFINRV